MVIVNGDFKKDIEVILELPKSNKLIMVTPENQVETKYSGENITIPANGAVVIIEKIE